MKTRPARRVYVADPAAPGKPALRRRLVRTTPVVAAAPDPAAGAPVRPPASWLAHGHYLAEALAYFLGFDVVAGIEFLLAI